MNNYSLERVESINIMRRKPAYYSKIKARSRIICNKLIDDKKMSPFEYLLHAFLESTYIELCLYAGQKVKDFSKMNDNEICAEMSRILDLPIDKDKKWYQIPMSVKVAASIVDE